MNLKIDINLDNAAFDGENWAFEAERILKEFTDEISFSGLCRPGDSESLLDINGNVVGKAKLIR